MILWVALVIAGVMPVWAGTAGQADWKISIVPAELNADRMVKLVADYAQQIYIMPQVRKEVYDAAGNHDIVVEVDMPAGMDLLDQGGAFTERAAVKKELKDHGRRIITMTITVRHKALNAMGRLRSVWKGQSLLVKAPADIAGEQSWIAVTVIDVDGERYSNRYDLAVMPMKNPGVQLRNLRIGLWNYGMRSISGAGCDDLAAFLKTVGVNYLQNAGAESLSLALKSHGIVDGGAVHHSVFTDREFPNQHADPSRSVVGTMSLACPSVVHHRASNQLAGVAELAQKARSRHGHVTVDYEPNIKLCFCDECIAAFKSFSGASDQQVEKLRKAVVSMSEVDRVYTTDSELMELQKQWVAFRSEYTAQYIGALVKGFKELYPEGVFELTGFRSFRLDEIQALWYGTDAATIAQYLDVVLPQIYYGYGAAEAKLVINMAGQWRRRIDREGWACKLCPLLLVRYPGATIYNTPNRVASQIIGTIAEGADGVVLFYSEQMDAPYWTMLAEATRLVGRFEAYYTQGKRVDDQFTPVMMDEGQSLVSPHEKRIPVDNPSWHFTAHEWDGKTLLTLQNLHEANDMWYRFEMAGGKDAWEIAESFDAPQYSGGWLIPPQKTGFVILKQKGKEE